MSASADKPEYWMWHTIAEFPELKESCVTAFLIGNPTDGYKEISCKSGQVVPYCGFTPQQGAQPDLWIRTTRCNMRGYYRRHAINYDRSL